MTDPVVRDAWARLLGPLIPTANARVADVGSGTGGLGAGEVVDLVLRHRREATVTRLDDAALWGKPVDDERYLVVSRG